MTRSLGKLQGVGGHCLALCGVAVLGLFHVSRGSMGAGEARSVGNAQDEGAGPVSASHGNMPVLGPGFSFNLVKGESRDIEIPVDPSVSVFSLLVGRASDDGGFEARLLDPAGKEVPLVPAPALPGFEYSGRSIERGVWRLLVTAREACRVWGSIHLVTPLKLHMSVEGQDHVSGEPIQITAHLEHGTGPAAADTVVGNVETLTGRSVGSFSLTHAGSGLYQGTWVPAEGGNFTISIVARGTYRGYPFDRRTHAPWVPVLPRSVKILRVASSSANDADGDGLYEDISFDVEFDITSAGKYFVRARLTDVRREGGIDEAQDTDWEPGLRRLTFVFRGKEIVESGLRGRYLLTSLTVYGLSRGDLEADSAEDLYTTPPYSPEEFEKEPPRPPGGR